MNAWFDELGRRWSAAAGRRGKSTEAPALDSRVAMELLELARVAAHTQERRFAPLACFTAGVAAERLGTTDPALIAAYIEEVRKELEAEAPGEGKA